MGLETSCYQVKDVPYRKFFRPTRFSGAENSPRDVARCTALPCRMAKKMRALVGIRQLTDTTGAPAQPCFTLYSTSTAVHREEIDPRTSKKAKLNCLQADKLAVTKLNKSP